MVSFQYPGEVRLLHYSSRALLNLRRINPSDLRCGSVETCRSASGMLLSGSEDARENGRRV